MARLAAVAALVAAAHAALFDAKSLVINADGKRLAAELKTNGVVFAVFTSDGCGHCRNFAPAVNEAATGLDGVIRILNVQDQSAMGQYGIQGFPTVKIFGSDRANPTEYEGARTADGLVDAALKATKDYVKVKMGKKAAGNTGGNKSSSSSSGGSSGGSGNGAIEVTSSNYDEVVSKNAGAVFIMLYAPWCGHCNAMKGDWDQLANKMAGKVKVVKVDATQEQSLGGQFGTKGYPTLKMLPTGSTSASNAVDYNGGRDLNSMAAFAAKYGKTEIAQLINQDVFDANCGEKMCVIAFLPHLLDSSAKERKSMVKMLANAADRSAGLPVSWLWSQGGDQFDLEEKLRVHDLGFPTVVVVSKAKNSYGTMRGAFEADAVAGFMTQMTKGKVHLQSLPKEMPAIKKKAKWDGKDAPKDEL